MNSKIRIGSKSKFIHKKCPKTLRKSRGLKPKNMNTNQQLSGEIKKQIAEDLRNYITTMAGGSANKASKMLTGISSGYISLILNEKWDSIADDTWRKLQKQVSQRDSWNFVPIKGSRKLFTLLADSKEY